MATDKVYLVYTVYYPPGARVLIPREEFVVAGEPCFIGVHQARTGFRPNYAKHPNAKLRMLFERAKKLRVTCDWGPEDRGMTEEKADQVRRDAVRTLGTLITRTGGLLNVNSYGAKSLEPKNLRVNRNEKARVAKWRRTMSEEHGWRTEEE